MWTSAKSFDAEDDGAMKAPAGEAEDSWWPRYMRCAAWTWPGCDRVRDHAVRELRRTMTIVSDLEDRIAELEGVAGVNAALQEELAALRAKQPASPSSPPRGSPDMWRGAAVGRAVRA